MGFLDEKMIVITGGSLGIGFATAKKCVSEVATVCIAARNLTDLENALSDLKNMSKKNHRCYSLNVGQFTQVQNFTEWCVNEFGKIDGLVNCASIYGPIGKTSQVDMDHFLKALHINFYGTVSMCHSFVPIFNVASRKKIVNYSGGGAATPFPNYSAYATSKAAIVRFTENLSFELADEGFDVNCIAPGFVVTRLHQQTLDAGPEKASESFLEQTKQTIENGGVPPEKAADLTAFLLSEKSDGISGKFLSAPWDPWEDETFRNNLRNDKDLATLRRIDNKYFYKKV